MANLKKNIYWIILITFLFTILCFFISFMRYGKEVTPIIVSDILFIFGMFISFIGALRIVIAFIKFKSVVKRTPIGHEVEVKKDSFKAWSNRLFFSGILIFIISYLFAIM